MVNVKKVTAINPRYTTNIRKRTNTNTKLGNIKATGPVQIKENCYIWKKTNYTKGS